MYRVAAMAAINVYSDNIDLGIAEIQFGVVAFRGCRLQILAFAGTNEPADWIQNLRLWSKKGIKKGSYDAAMQANKVFTRHPGIPLLVTGHSKGAADAIAYNKLYGATWVVAFCPARSLRYWINRDMPNATLFIDPDDPVPALGCLSFVHPECHIEHLPDTFIGWDVRDHKMENILKWLRYAN